MLTTPIYTVRGLLTAVAETAAFMSWGVTLEGEAAVTGIGLSGCEEQVGGTEGMARAGG